MAPGAQVRGRGVAVSGCSFEPSLQLGTPLLTDRGKNGHRLGERRSDRRCDWYFRIVPNELGLRPLVGRTRGCERIVLM